MCGSEAKDERVISELNDSEIDALLEPLADYDFAKLGNYFCFASVKSNNEITNCEDTLTACQDQLKDLKSELSVAFAKFSEESSDTSETVTEEDKKCAIPVEMLKACISDMVGALDALGGKTYTCEETLSTEPPAVPTCDALEAKAKELGCEQAADAG